MNSQIDNDDSDLEDQNYVGKKIAKIQRYYDKREMKVILETQKLNLRIQNEAKETTDKIHVAEKKL